MKTFVLLSALVGCAYGAVTVTLANTCVISSKYTTAAAAGTCVGPKAGYIVTAFCQSPFHPNPGDIALAPTFTRQLTTASASAFSVVAAPSATIPAGCIVSSQLHASVLNGANAFVASLDPMNPNNCGAAAAALPVATAAATAATLTVYKGITILCDTANDYYVAAGAEGSGACADGVGTAVNLYRRASATSGGFSHTLLIAPSKNTANWRTDALTCARSCALPASLCTGAGLYHANTLFLGAGLIANTCNIRPATDISVWCRSQPFTRYTYRCSAATDNTARGTLAWVGDTPDCGGANGALTGAYSIAQRATGIAGPTAGAVPGFSGTAAISTVQTNLNIGQWGGFQRAAANFAPATTYKIDITGCPTEAAANAECVQEVVNWFRCKGLTIDTSAICFAAVSTRVACPTHTLGYRCPSSSKKGLLGLLGLIGIAPLLLCAILLCLLLLCLCRRKKTEGDVQFATFDPHAAPGGSYYAPSIGGIPTAVY